MSNVSISALPVGTATSSTPFAAVVAGVTDQVTLAPVYTSLAGKAATSHTHVSADITDLTSSGLDTQGHCRIQVDGTTSLSLQRYQGTTLPIKTGSTWAAMTIPSSGPALSNSGLTANVLHYIYAFNSSGTLTLEASTTTHAVDSTTGVEIKSGDATRTLVGMIFTDSGTPGTFVDSNVKRWCINWFNRLTLDVQGTISANRNMTNFSFVEPNSEIRTPFLTWANEPVSAAISGSIKSNSASDIEFGMGVAFDGTTPEACCGGLLIKPGTDGQRLLPFSVHVWKVLSEGSHYATMVGAFSDSAAGLCTVYTADTASSGRMKAWVRVAVKG